MNSKRGVFEITGKVITFKRGIGVGGATVEAWDKDFASKHMLGKATTDKTGTFKITYNQLIIGKLYKDKNPDIYFKVYKDDRLIASTEKEVYWNILKPRLDIIIKVPEESIFNYDDDNKSISFNGYVYHVASNPISNIKVSLYEKNKTYERLVKSCNTNNDGFYNIDIKLDKKMSSFVLKVLDSSNKDIAVSGIINNTSNDNKVNFIVDDNRYKGNSSYDVVCGKVSKYIDLRQLSKLNLGEIRQEFSYISKRSNVKEKEIEYYINSLKIANELDVNAKNIYAFLKLGSTASIDAIISQSSSDMTNTLLKAASKNIINITAEEIPLVIDSLKTAYAQKLLKNDDSESLLGLFKVAIEDKNKCAQIVKSYISSDGSKKSVWDAIDKTKDKNEDLTKIVKTVFKLGALTGGYIPITAVLLNELKKTKKYDIKYFAGWDKETFYNLIERTSRATRKLCVPSFIEGKDNNTKMLNYASKMAEIVSKAYPTEFFKRSISKNSNINSPIVKYKDELTQFFNNNPTFKLGECSHIHIKNKNINFNGIKDKIKTVELINTANRLYRLTSSFEGVQALINDGLDSSIKIYECNKEAFCNKYSEKFGSKKRAENVYQKAEMNFVSSVNLLLKLHPNYLEDCRATIDFDKLFPTADAQAEWRTLFGSLERPEIEECRTIYSPGAYLTNILDFLKSSNTEAFKEFTRRRSDILDMELNCTNTSTPLPYIDLVIELLEKLTVKYEGNESFDITKSYQTNLSSDELKIYPENIITEAYDILKNQVYPFNLPFDLFVNEIREYLALTGISRVKIMEDFMPLSTDNITSDSPEYLWSCEYLGLSPSEASIILGEDKRDSRNNPWLLFGFDKENGFTPIIDPSDTSKTLSGNWFNTLTNRVDVFIKQTQITYIELLNILDTNYINPYTHKNRRLITINTINSDIMQDTAELNKLKLTGLNTNTLIKIINFLRLKNRLGLTHRDLDIILTGIKFDFNKPETMITLANLIYLVKNYNISVEEAVSYFGYINTTTYRKNERYNAHEGNNQTYITSLFERLFNNRNVTGSQDSQLLKLIDKNKDIIIDEKIKQEMTSSFSVSIKAIENYLEYLNYSSDNILNLERLSNIYRHIRFSALLKMTFKELVLLKEIMHQDPFTNPKQMQTFIKRYHNMLDFDLNVENIMNLLYQVEQPHINPDTHKYINELKIALSEFIEKRIKEDNNTNEDLNIITKEAYETALSEYRDDLKIILVKMLSDKFSINDDLMMSIIEKTKSIDHDLMINVFLSIDFLYSSDNITAVYKGFARIKKTVYIASKLMLNSREFTKLVEYAKTVNEIIDLSILPIEEISSEDRNRFKGLEHLVNLVISRNLVQNSKTYIETFVDIYNCPFEKWSDKISEFINIDKTSIKLLTNKLNAKYPEDFIDGSIVGKLLYCKHSLDLINMKEENIDAILTKSPTVDDTRLVMNTVKSVFNENDWYEAAKEARNKLREKQRQALASYVLTHPDKDNKQYWRSYNEMFEYLLLDVEVTPKVITSRLKQAISSVQLFIDRILLGEERANLKSLSKPFTLSEDDTAEWKKWRKFYRIWEANRKILLYPENWIEPELRDNKSPFFTQLEAQLNQNELTNEYVEDAFFTYLDKLDTVSKLDIKDVFREVDHERNINILHVLGRSQSTPYKYYYRYRSDGEWSYWQQIKLDIQGEQTALVMWNRRLFVIWLEIIEEPEMKKVEVDLSKDKIDIEKAKKRLKIKLAWSQFWQGRWNEKRMSTNAVYSDFLYDEELILLKESLFIKTKFENGYLTVYPLSSININSALISANVKNSLVSLGQYFRFYDCSADPVIHSCTKNKVHIVMPTEIEKHMQYMGNSSLKKANGYNYEVSVEND